MLKNYKRALRRHQKKVKLVKRVKKWINQKIVYYGWPDDYRTKQQEREAAMRGECYTFLRTTGRPCNCNGCTYLKYEREARHKWMKKLRKEYDL